MNAVAALDRDFPTPKAPSGRVWHPKPAHFEPDAPSSRAPDESIKPHGSHSSGAAMNKELEAYPKCL